MSGFVENVTKVLSGNLAAIGISILTLPIITRMYGPESYGILVVFNALLNTIAPMSCLGYEKVILLQRLKKSIQYSFICSLISLFITTGVVGLIFLFGHEWISDAIGLPDSVQLFSLIVFAVFINGLVRLFTFRSVKDNEFSKQAYARIAESSVDRIIGISLGLISPSAITLVIARTSGLFISLYVLLKGRLFNLSALIGGFSFITQRHLFLYAKRYSNFILSALAALMNGIARDLPVLMLAGLFSPASAAYFGIGKILIGMPLTQIANSVSKPFFHKISVTRESKNDLKKSASELLKYLIYIALFPVLTVMSVGDIMVTFIFGEEWGVAGLYAQLMAAAYFFSYLYMPMGAYFEILEMQKNRMYLISTLLISTLFALMYGAKLYDADMAILLLGIISAIIYCMGVFYVLHLLGYTLLSSMKTLITYSLMPLIFSVPLFMGRLFEIETYLLIIMLLVLSMSYYGLLVKTNISSIRAIINKTKNKKGKRI